MYTIEQIEIQCYKSYTFSILKHYIIVYLSKIQIERNANKDFSFSIIKEIVIVKDDLYYFIKDLEFRRYRNSNKKEGKKTNLNYCRNNNYKY